MVEMLADLQIYIYGRDLELMENICWKMLPWGLIMWWANVNQSREVYGRDVWFLHIFSSYVVVKNLEDMGEGGGGGKQWEDMA